MTEPNVLLDALIEQAGFTHAGFAARTSQYGNQRGMEFAERAKDQLTAPM